MKDLDQMLHDDAREVLPDGGFTRRVMRALPPAVPATRAWLTPVLVLGATALGSALAIALAPAHLPIAEGFLDLARLRGLTPAALAAVGMGAALMFPALVLALEDD